MWLNILSTSVWTVQQKLFNGLITWDWIIFITVLSIKTWGVFYVDPIVCVTSINEGNNNIIVMS